MTTDTTDARGAHQQLVRALPPGRVLTGEAFEASRRIWNGAVDHHPAIIVRPETPDEVRIAVLTAREHHLPLSVRGGGHDFAGRSICDGGLVIDLSARRRVAIDPERRLAVVQGGATARDVADAARAHHLGAATGTTGGVGMAGLTAGGGYGPYTGRLGLALDTLISAEMVLADGRRVNASNHHEPDLFWAIRGGGGNFGVITSMRIRLFPVDTIQAGMITYPWTQATQVWSRLGDILSQTPDELTVFNGILPGPDGIPTVFIFPVWSGPIDQGQHHIDQLTTIGTPQTSHIDITTPADMLTQFDAQVVNGRHYNIQTRNVTHYTPELITALVDCGDNHTSRYSAVYIHHFHGAATRIDPHATAFGQRAPHHLIEIVPAWEHPDDAPTQQTWADTLSHQLTTIALPGGYPNLLAPDRQNQINHAYGPNTARLLTLKKQYDPHNTFAATPLPPQPH